MVSLLLFPLPTPLPFADDVEVCDWFPPVAVLVFLFEELPEFFNVEFPELETVDVDETFPTDALPPVAEAVPPVAVWF